MSQQFSVPGKQMDQLDAPANNYESTIRMGLMGPASNDPMAQDISVSNLQMQLSDPMSNKPILPKLPTSNKQTGQTEFMGYNLESQQFFMPNRQVGGMEAMSTNAGLQQSLVPTKRKAPMEPAPQQFLTASKRVGQVDHRPWLQQIYTPNQKTVQMQSISSSPGLQHFLAPSKKMLQVGSIPSKSGLQQVSTPKNRTSQVQPSTKKMQTESFESVRSKLRESLASALALVSQEQDKPSDVGNKSQGEVRDTPGQTRENSQPVGFSPASAGAVDCVSGESKEEFSPGDQKHNDDQSVSGAFVHFGNSGSSMQIPKCNGEELQLSNVFPDEDVSFSDNFFVKDELLQGNGLSWVMDPLMEVSENKEIQTVEKQKSNQVGGNRGEQAGQSPQILASQIEAELFKLYGGVNKKYKEKGRSLLFNLKDRSNPELRERVMSGDIPPKRLCSMTAEELASKELSEWRIAKAEELAQMVVLPDSDVDIRRLVKKTHKGEFQVEVEQDDGVSVEVAVGTSSHTRIQSKTSEKEDPLISKPNKTKAEVKTASGKSNSEGQGSPYTLTIASNEDLMQGLIDDDDGLKDAEFLPPIVSLDEFMESLDSEPPFQNLPAKTTRTMDKDDLEVGPKLKSPDLLPKDPVDTTTDKPEKSDGTDTKQGTDVKHTDELDADVKASEKTDVDRKPIDSYVKSESAPPEGKLIWEGLLQLNISATVSISAFFKSGEKATPKEWPSCLEIKGRVRLDAFEKFLQDLRLSRSRSTMVVHFALKDGVPESEHASIHEVADSYISDERVGIAEPAPTVELYLCPPHKNTIEMLSKMVPKDDIDLLNAIDNGLIGVIVWRKPSLTSAISPNSSSHHKHNSKRQQHSSRRQQEKDTNMNPNFAPKPPMPPPETKSLLPVVDDGDDDDAPPGFGPGAPRDEDDLPEFNFSNPSMATRNNPQGHRYGQNSSRDQIRDLIHRYGQPKGAGTTGDPWNDDDDDIPEWQPEVSQRHSRPVHGFQQQVLRPHMIDQPHLVSAPPQQPLRQPMIPLGMQSLHPPTNMMQNAAPPSVYHQGSWWVPPVQGNNPLNNPQQQSSVVGCQPSNVGHYYGAPGQPGSGWGGQDVPKSTGF